MKQVKRNTHPARSHPIEERRHADRGVEDPCLVGGESELDSSSAWVKVTDEALYVDGSTFGLVEMRIEGGGSVSHGGVR